MSGSLSRFLGLCFVSVALASTGCSQVRGRRRIQQGNQLYRDAQYADANAAFEEAEKYVPDFWVLWLNKGYNCRQMIIPGAKTPESLKASKCALDSFKRLQELKPEDPRGELLYIQTLFDADKFEELSKMYEERYQKNPRDIDNITGLIQVYSKWGKVDEALEWYTKKAEVQANDAEAQYAVGVFIWQQLMVHGGGPDKATFDPRPDPNHPKAKKIPPPWGVGDLVSQQRVDLADKGIEYLNKALALRPKYFEAMVYVNLLYRQKSFAQFDDPPEWQKSVDKAKEWMCKSIETQGKAPPAVCTQKGGGGAAQEGDQIGKEGADADVTPDKPVKGKKGKAAKGGGKKKAGAKKKHAKR
jgi:tetratricopeptide (TPR) repeat protein